MVGLVDRGDRNPSLNSKLWAVLTDKTVKLRTILASYVYHDSQESRRGLPIKPWTNHYQSLTRTGTSRQTRLVSYSPASLSLQSAELFACTSALAGGLH